MFMHGGIIDLLIQALMGQQPHHAAAVRPVFGPVRWHKYFVKN
jgi:hypothetical protein